MKPFVLVRLFLTAAICAFAMAAMPLSAQEPPAEPMLSADDFSAERSFRYRKTLFQWFDGQPQFPESTSDRIVTDRPHFSEASNLVGLGHIQLETGYTITHDRSQGTAVTSHSFPEPLLRAGILAEWFEFRIAANYLAERTITGAGPSTWQQGADDMYIGAKLALTQQYGYLPEVALFPQMRVPVGSAAFTSREVLPGFNLAYSWAINDWLELECNSQLNRRLDGNGLTYYTEAIQTINFEYEIAERIGGFTEWIAFMPAQAATELPQHYLHGGFVYFVSDDFQLDFHVGMGLNEPAANLAFTGMGASYRW